MNRPKSFLVQAKGFSLVEIALAIGIVAFALISIVGLLPVGLRSMQDAIEQDKATEILNSAATAVRGQYYLGQGPSGTPYYYSFANYLSENDPAAVAADTASPWSLHAKYNTGEVDWDRIFGVLDDGNIRRAGDNTAVAYQLYVHVFPPSDIMTPVRVYLSVAWPGAATYGAKGWTKQQGQVETVIYANPPSLN